jgi:hypothetical protein
VVVFVVTAFPTATAAAALTAAIAATTAATAVVATAAAAVAAALAVATTAMDGGLLLDIACVRCAVRRSPHAHKEPWAKWKGLFNAESFSTFNYSQTVESGKKSTNFD